MRSQHVGPLVFAFTAGSLLAACEPASVEWDEPGAASGAEDGGTRAAGGSGGAGTSAAGGRGGTGGGTATGGRGGSGSGGADGGASPARDGGAAPAEPVMVTPAGPNGLRSQNMFTDPAAALFDDTKVHTIAIVLDAANLQKLEQTAAQEMWVQGEVTIDGTKLAPVGIRYKGNYTLTYCIQNRCRKSYKIDFAEFKPDQRYLGLKRLNVHVMFNDETYMRDRLAYGIQRDFGVPAPRAAHAKVTVNGKAMGLYVMVEAIDGQFVRARFADGKGNVYKDAWPANTTADYYLKRLKTNRDDMPNVDRMVRFANALKATTETNFESVLSQWMDLDVLAKTIAVDRAIMNWDGPIDSWYCFGGRCANHNFFMYEEAARDRIWLLLWDMNDTFKPFLFKQIHGREGMPEFPDPMTKSCSQEIRILGGGTPAKPYYCDDILRKVAAVLRPRIVAAEKQLLETHFSVRSLQARIDKMIAEIEPAVAEMEKAGITMPPQFQLAKWKNDVRNLRDGFVNEMVNDFRMRVAAGR